MSEFLGLQFWPAEVEKREAVTRRKKAPAGIILILATS